jgi:hypothetical protein
VCDALYHTLLAPYIHSANGNAVNRNDFEAICCTYDGVVDAKSEGQHEIAPTDLRYMNYVRLTLVTTTAWNAAQKTAFLDWLYERRIANLNIDLVDATPVGLDVIAKVFCKTSADLNEVKTYLVDHVQTKFKLRRGILGSSFYLSDIYEALAGEGIYRDLITIVQITNPVTDVILTGELAKTRYIKLNSVQLDMQYDKRSFVEIEGEF